MLGNKGVVMRILRGLVGLGGLALAGCFPTDGIVVRTGAGGDQAPFCGAGVYGYLVDEPAAAALDVPDPKRIIRPGDVVTMDYNPSRTNVEVDADDMIVRVYCG